MQCTLQAVMKACQTLKDRLEQQVGDELKKDGKKDRNDDPTWLDLVTKAYNNGIDLSEKYL